MKSIVCKTFNKPFTHSIGKSLIIPRSNLQITCFPAKLFLHLLDEEKTLVAEIDLDIQGPVKEFTWEVDLHNNWANLHFLTQEAPVSLRFIISQQALKIICRRSAKEGVKLNVSSKGFLNKAVSAYSLAKGEETLLCFSSMEVYEDSGQARLFLGSLKKQNLDQMKEREDIKEWLPLFFTYASLCKEKEQGMQALCYKELENAGNNELNESFFNLFKVHFKDFFSPSFFDSYFQNIQTKNDKVLQGLSHVSLLSSLYPLILNLFINFEGKKKLCILPKVPPQIPSGKLIGLKISSEISISIQWSKKKLRQVEIYCHEDVRFTLGLSKAIKSFRIFSKAKTKAQIISADKPIEFCKNTRYFLDRFTS
ncbi:hypothetical protein AB751O23_AI_00040 [Chlamydiales bacterium SCGC AB-751-O23]|jgi:hypothetical protein|nr:hypothetical protein AB751O23_AI_00040 [Chlamydiales bacterium SCGC AB-751-O23]